MSLARGRSGSDAKASVDAHELAPGAWLLPPVVVGDTHRSLTWSRSSPATPDAVVLLEARLAGGVAGPIVELKVHEDEGRGRLHLAWEVLWPEHAVAAMEFPLMITLDGASEHSLLVPGIHYGWEDRTSSPSSPTYGRYPRLDPVRGFAIRADRLPQPAVVVGDAERSWTLLARTETPSPPRPEFVFSVFAGPSSAGSIRIGFRYPQAEYGHWPEGDDLAYVAKGAFGHGEERSVRWQAGDRLSVELDLLSTAGPPEVNAGAAPRHMWSLARASRSGSTPPLAIARERVRWIGHHLWNEDLGQYESPEGSGTAMTGFVEMSLTLACVVARVASIADDMPAMDQGMTASRLWVSRSHRAIDSWLRDGIDSDGLLLPVRDASGFHLGRRRYDADPGDDITEEPVVESIRVTAECRSILGLLRQSPAWLAGGDAGDWRTQVVKTARWLARQCVDGVLPGVVGATGAEEGDDRGSAHLVSLLADIVLDEPSDLIATELLSRAQEVYHVALAPRIARRAFGGVTLDAACPDREAVAASLDASLIMFEATGDDRYLRDAAVAVDILLTYVFAYSISTFGAASDASERAISTLGASLVSAENQHLDPFPVGPLLVRYGLFTGDDAAIAAGMANTAWCLDARWAIRNADGIKQPEQFCHTAWHYNAYFTHRGDFRRGMPVHGRSDSEHGWAQALPLSALLEQGHATLDWPTGRAAGLPGLEVRVQRHDAGYRVDVTSSDGPSNQPESPLLLRIWRPPGTGSIQVASETTTIVAPWPAVLTSVPVVHGASGSLILTAR